MVSESYPSTCPHDYAPKKGLYIRNGKKVIVR